MDTSARDDALAGILMLLVALPFVVATGSIYVDPLDPGFGARDFPILVLGLIILLSAGLLIRAVVAVRRQGTELYVQGEETDAIRYLLPMAAIGFLYVWFVYMFQYAGPTFLASVAALVMFGNRGWGRLVVAPFIATVVYYILFYGILGLDEAPGKLIAFDNQHFFRPMRNALGLF